MTHTPDTVRLHLQGRRILLANDNEFTQIQVSDLLGDFTGVPVAKAVTSLEVLEYLRDHPIDAVLMDIQMAGLDGLETMRRLRQLPGMAMLPVIALTAHSSDPDRQFCAAAGMNDFVAKPIDPPALLDTLVRWFMPVSEAVHLPPAVVPMLSVEVGMKRCFGKRDVYEKIARRYLAIRGGVIDEMDAAWRAGEFGLALRIAHSMISTAGTLGAVGLSELSCHLQEAARVRDTVQWQALLALARTEHAAVCAALRGYLEPSTSHSN